MTAVYVAAGSNVDAVANLERALRVLQKHYPAMRVSTAYRNKAVGFAGEDFVNLVVGFDTRDDISRVITHLHEAETACGRPRDAPKWAPRSMDLDLLLYGNEIRDEPGLKLPRPDLLKRPYMLQPMAELAPSERHPLLGKTMRELWYSFAGEGHPMQPVALNI